MVCGPQKLLYFYGLARLRRSSRLTSAHHSAGLFIVSRYELSSLFEIQLMMVALSANFPLGFSCLGVKLWVCSMNSRGLGTRPRGAPVLWRRSDCQPVCHCHSELEGPLLHGTWLGCVHYHCSYSIIFGYSRHLFSGGFVPFSTYQTLRLGITAIQSYTSALLKGWKMDTHRCITCFASTVSVVF